MAVSYIRPAGGLPAAAKALLVPENIRAGVHIKGGGVDVVGALTYKDLLPANLVLLAAAEGLNGITGGIQRLSGSGGGTYMSSNSLYVPNCAPEDGSESTIGTVNAIDFSGYDSLLITVQSTGNCTFDNKAGYGVGTAFSASSSFTNYADFSGDPISKTFNISAINDARRILFYQYRYGSGRNMAFRIISIVLSRNI